MIQEITKMGGCKKRRGGKAEYERKITFKPPTKRVPGTLHPLPKSAPEQTMPTLTGIQ